MPWEQTTQTSREGTSGDAMCSAGLEDRVESRNELRTHLEGIQSDAGSKEEEQKES